MRAERQLRASSVTERVVLAHGCFDLIHLGHIRHLQEARALGDRLVVSITADRHVDKGQGRPQFSTEQRREALLALSCVDEVVVSESGTAEDVIASIKPAVYVKGPDYAHSSDPDMLREIAAVESVGGRFHVTTSEKWSSTKLLRSVRLPDSTLAYLESARQRGFLDAILAAFDRADKLNIGFIGETIIDEYRYVKPLARPSKEFILATVGSEVERFDGGILAAAKHADWPKVSIATSAQAIVKTRFVDADFSRKLFEVYSAHELELSSDDRAVLRRRIGGVVNVADICVVMDFGHGLFGNMERETVQQAEFLALTAQTNAANYGFNTIGKYTKADYVCIDEPEARLAVRETGEPLAGMCLKIQQHTKAKAVTITRGRHGCACGLKAVPSFVDGGRDTMGAGDAFLAVAAPLVAVGLDIEMACVAGNVAGGLKTSILGHRDHVRRDDIVKNLEWLLK